MRGDRDEALANARAAVPYLHRGGDPPGLLLSIALVHARHGAEGRAAALLGYVDREFGRAGRVFFPMLMRIREEIVARAQATLEPEDLQLKTSAGAALNEQQALSLALDDVIV